jgi:lactate dehydrogenase-like 2-hydroxyacid dehydrogenase
MTLPPPQWQALPDLLRNSDFLVLTVPYGPETHHCLNDETLALMPAHAILINVARGGVVDDAALVRALRRGQLAGAALDVMENEPAFVPDLLALDNVVLTPHIGSATVSSRRAMVSLAVDNVRRVLAGSRPAALLNPDAWPPRQANRSVPHE